MTVVLPEDNTRRPQTREEKNEHTRRLLEEEQSQQARHLEDRARLAVEEQKTREHIRNEQLTSTAVEGTPGTGTTTAES